MSAPSQIDEKTEASGSAGPGKTLPFFPSPSPTSADASPIDAHTLESACVELVSGRALLMDADGARLVFPTTETRALFQWYLQNRQKWTQRVQRGDVDALVDRLGDVPQVLRPTLVSTTSTPRILHLHQVRAHQFAGLHRHGPDNRPPQDFTLTFDRPLTVIEGTNGAGKTSILNAIIWCLTGQVLRAQRPPESAEQPMPIELPGDGDGPERKHEVVAIAPVPPAQTLRTFGDSPVPLDTWVELSFVDESGASMGTLRRAVVKTPRGHIRTREDFSNGLTIDPLARHIGTTMPGLIQHIQFERPSELGKAVASLTGLQPLQELAKHAAKSRELLRGDLLGTRLAELNKTDQDFRDVLKSSSDPACSRSQPKREPASCRAGSGPREMA